jgi:hypothetical protein
MFVAAGLFSCCSATLNGVLGSSPDRTFRRFVVVIEAIVYRKLRQAGSHKIPIILGVTRTISSKTPFILAIRVRCSTGGSPSPFSWSLSILVITCCQNLLVNLGSLSDTLLFLAHHRVSFYNCVYCLGTLVQGLPHLCLLSSQRSA